MKASSISIIIAVAVIAAIVLVCSFAVLSNAFAPLAQREDKTFYTPKANVVIQANTFNGNIEFATTTGSQIEVTYNIEAPQGFLNNVKTSTNETKSGDVTTLVANAATQGQATIVNLKADILIKVPNTSKYNLSLTTQNGNIIKPQLNDTRVLATTGNGNIDLKDDNCTELNAMAMNGNIKIGLAKGTQFQVAASVGNGNISYQGIALDTTTQTATRLKGVTSDGEGNLTVTLLSGNGNITIEYLNP